MINIAVIGAGQLGSRHLQGLARLNIENNIYVIDPSKESLETAMQRFDEIQHSNTKKIFFSEEIDIKDKLDIAIIATNSLQRREVIEKLLNSVKVDYLIIEKFLFPSLEDYSAIETLISEKCKGAWVNCVRRAYDFYNSIKNQISGEEYISYNYNGYNLRPASNSIHHLDLFSYLCGSFKLDIDSTGLDANLLKAKRDSYVEFKGTIIAKADKNIFMLTSYNTGNAPAVIEIKTPRYRYFIEEGKRQVIKSFEENNWEYQTGAFEYPMQSALTNLIVEEIIKEGSCKLTDYKESFYIHKQFLKSIFEFYKTKRGEDISFCPIT
ncbi:MAG TPA: Gfo/Idh/MocA family oxidoreductase [Ignavibacteria bacterium]|nr:Gfo/Idh/MocA family oxidoreductase [Ignavibacteria bacterium]